MNTYESIKKYKSIVSLLLILLERKDSLQEEYDYGLDVLRKYKSNLRIANKIHIDKTHERFSFTKDQLVEYIDDLKRIIKVFKTDTIKTHLSIKDNKKKIKQLKDSLAQLSNK